MNDQQKPAPEKLTLAWFYHHLTVDQWWKLGSILATIVLVTFTSGVWFGKWTSGKPEVFDEADLIGDWQWHYPEAGWQGTVTFSRGQTGVVFEGKVYKVDVEPRMLLYKWQGGTARLIDGRQLALVADNVEDYHYGDGSNPRRIRWRTNSPLKRDFSFAGDLIGTDNNGADIGHWGFSFYHPPH